MRAKSIICSPPAQLIHSCTFYAVETRLQCANSYVEHYLRFSAVRQTARKGGHEAVKHAPTIAPRMVSAYGRDKTCCSHRKTTETCTNEADPRANVTQDSKPALACLRELSANHGIPR